jgi:hypothetical protein
VEVIEPLSGYAIVRGIDPTYPGEPEKGQGVGVGPWPSDHIVLPLEWSNGTGTPVLIKQPVLVLTELSQNGEPIRRKFFLVGEFDEASTTVFNDVNKKPPSFTNSLVLDPHSVLQGVFVFRINKWDTRNLCFRFHQGQRYEVDLLFDRHPQDLRVQWGWWVLGWLTSGSKTESVTQQIADDLPILTTANWISPYGKGNVGWDFVSLLPGSRAARSQGLNEDATKHFIEADVCRNT